MLRVTITTRDANTVWLDFPDQTSADAYIAEIAASQHWGSNDFVEVIDARDEVSHEETVTNDDGSTTTTTVIDQPAVAAQSIDHPATWSYAITDVTAQVSAETLLKKGLEAQTVGASCVAQVYALNEAKFALGTLTSQDFQTILADPTLAMIERLLWNGSLTTAKSMIQSYTGLAFSQSDKDTVIAIIDSSGLI